MCGKLKEAGTMTSVSRPGSLVAGTEPIKQCAAGLA